MNLVKKIFSVVAIASIVFSVSFTTTNAQKESTELPPGVVINEPPTDWDPLNATDEELELYSYPPRPTDLEEIKEWEKVVSGKWVKPKFKDGIPIGHARKKQKETPEIFGTYITNPSWAGVIRNGVASRVVGWWTQPTTSADSYNRPATAAHWIGLGGYSSSTADLIQTGTVGRVSSTGTVTYEAMYEIVGTSHDTGTSKTLTSVTVRPGDKMYADITFNNGTASFYITNQTNGTVSSFKVTNITDYNGITDSQEWISERPLLTDGTYRKLAKFGSVNWTGKYGAAGSTSTYYPTDSSAYTRYVTMQENSTTLCSVSTIGSTGNFTTTWQAYSGDGVSPALQ